MRLLCVEDEKPLREDIVEYLKQHSYEVDEASSGEEALQHLEQDSYDAVLCDIKMPRMDGFDVLRRLRADNPNTMGVPFIFLSALTGRDDRVRAHHWGCDAYLTKPIDFAVLDATIKSHVEKSRATNYIFTSLQDSLRNHIVVTMEEALRHPTSDLARLTDYLITALPKLDPDRTKEYLERMREQLSKQSRTLELLTTTLTMQVPQVPLTSGAILLEELLTDIALHCYGSKMANNIEITLDNASKTHYIRGDIPLLAKALEELLMAAQPHGGKKIALYGFYSGDHCDIGVADHAAILANDGNEFFRVEPRMDLTSLAPVTRQRIVPILFADAVARMHGGSLELKLWERHWMAARITIPQNAPQKKPHHSNE